MYLVIEHYMKQNFLEFSINCNKYAHADAYGRQCG